MSKMVQTRRRARQRGAALLRLPTDVLHKIATHTVAPGLVVAAGSNLEARTALRKGTDEAERSRFGGIGLTIREAEQVLRTRYASILDESYLETRAAARHELDCGRMVILRADDHPDAPEDDEDWVWYNGKPFLSIASQFIRTMLAFGVDPNVHDPEDGATPLHIVAESPNDDSINLVRLLLGAGADIDAECHPDNGAGRTPLSWCIVCELTTGEPKTEWRYELATFLIEQGCDVARACAAYEEDWGTTLLEELQSHESTPESERFMAYFLQKLEALGITAAEA